jgi:hypothetical protein
MKPLHRRQRQHRQTVVYRTQLRTQRGERRDFGVRTAARHA